MFRKLLVSAILLVPCIALYDGSPSASEARVPRVAGTLSCVTDPDVSLVFGRAPVGRCAFAPADGSRSHHYLAMFEAVRPDPSMPREETLSWDVRTRDGRLARGALGGEFVVKGQGLARTDEAASGPTLVPTTAEARLGARFVAIAPRVILASGR